MRARTIDTESIATIRLLAVDMVEKAKSGHPGLPLGAAPMAYTLFAKIMRYNPANPAWINRDRFILSAGHGSAMLYALLHLAGFGLTIEELQAFRQLGSRTPGHPEYCLTPGVETTTGPLGQGIATAVGMASAERFLASKLNTAERTLIDYYTYVICSDGDLMEGVSSEASSLAGHLQLGRLICLYDNNHISIEGSTQLAFTEDVARRYEAYGWHVQHIDGNDLDAIELAVRNAQEIDDQPSMIIVDTTIGYGSPHKAGTASAHGEPLGPDEAKLVKRAFGFDEDESFVVPDRVYDNFREVAKRGATLEAEWRTQWQSFERDEPALASALTDLLAGRFPESWLPEMPEFTAGEKLATRQASKSVLARIAEKVPLLAGGSADLAPSTGTLYGGTCNFEAESYGCQTFHFGVREHSMGAIVNGMALSKMMVPYGATFLVFADYMKPALRIAALMQSPSIFIFTHDSIGLGEDGPTHQPIEQLAMLRAMPGFDVYRPADANETAAVWLLALKRRKPAALVLTRQALPVIDPSVYPVAREVPRGGYVLADWNTGARAQNRRLILIATGSEIHTALEARILLHGRGIPTRVVSMPSQELFEEQTPEYRQEVLPSEVRQRVVIEAATAFGWHRYAGDGGIVIGMDRFGISAPGAAVLEKFGFTPEGVAAKAAALFEAVSEGYNA
jgi:transketolase